MASSPSSATRLNPGSFDLSHPSASTALQITVTSSSPPKPHPHAFVTKGPETNSFDRSQPPDFWVQVEDESIAVHKELLGSAVLYFRCLFASGMQEVEKETLTLHGFKASVARTLLQYVYGEKISITWEDITEHLNMVEFWQMTDLKDQMESYIAKNISTSDCLFWFVTGRGYTMEKVQKSSMHTVASEFQSVAQQPDFNDLDFESFLALISKDLVTQASCDQRLRACIDWILADETNRDCHYTELLEKMELTKFPENFTRVLQDVIMKTSQADIMKPYLDQLLKKPGTTESSNCEGVVLGLCEHYEYGSFVLRYDLERGTHDIVGKLPQSLESFTGCCSTPHGIFVSSGQSGRYYKSVLLHYPSLMHVCLPDLPYPVHKEKIVFAADRVHVYSESGPNSTTLYSLDMKTLEWTSTTTLPVRLVCSMGPKIYAVTRDNGFYCYDTGTGVWSRASKARPPKRTATSCCAVACGREIFVIKGDHGLSAKYSIDTDTWTTLTQYRVPYMHCQATAKNSTIMVYNMQQCDSFLLIDNSWDGRLIDSLSNPRGLQNFHMIVV